MGTRHLIGWITKDGTPRGWYNQFDGYPSGIGRDLQAQLTQMVALPSSDGIRWIEGEDQHPSAEDRQWAFDHGLVDSAVSTGTDWYATLRNLQGRLDLVVQLKIALSAGAFLKDSLFCEWAYLIDERSNEIAICKGFNMNKEKQAPYAALTEEEEAQERANAARYRDRGVYYGVEEVWRGSREAFLALDMEKFEEGIYAAQKAEEEAEEAAKAAAGGAAPA